jgi:nucleotide-binding universal stress UspA family protein
MVSYDRILIPTDGSEASEVTVEHGIELAEKFDAEVHVIHIVDVRVQDTHDIYDHLVGNLKEAGRNATESIQEEFEEKNLKASTEVIEGIPHKEIINFSEENDIDLILMGTEGKTGLDRILLGSTTEKVLRTSDIPVMTVRKNKEE